MDEKLIITYNTDNLLSLVFMLTAEIFTRRYRYTRNSAICYQWCLHSLLQHITGFAICKRWYV